MLPKLLKRTPEWGALPPRLVTAIPGPRSRELTARLTRVECPDITAVTPEFPVVWSRARGANVEDADGNVYIDLNGGFGVAAVGHGHPRVLEAVADQSARLMHGMGDVHPNEPKIRLAEALAARAPGGGEWKSIFGLGGSDAIEAALKTAALATGRAGVISFRDGYHGLSLGALGVTGWDRFRHGFEDSLGPRARLIAHPGSSAGEAAAAAVETALREVERALERNDGGSPRVGALLIEPILGRGGIVPAPPGFLQQLKDLCERHGALLILDEIYTGGGRTGTFFACEAEGVVPDLIACGKALGGGMPISVCLGRAEIMDRWGPSPGGARHTSTFQGHPVACAAALAALQVMDEEDLIDAARSKGAALKARLEERLGAIPGVAQIRGRGMMLGVELRDPETGEPDPRRAWNTVLECLRRGVILLTAGPAGNVLSLTPPLVITEDQLQCAVETMAGALEAAQE